MLNSAEELLQKIHLGEDTFRFDEQTVPETSIGDLRPHLYHRFLKDSAEDESLVLRKLPLLKTPRCF